MKLARERCARPYGAQLKPVPVPKRDDELLNGRQPVPLRPTTFGLLAELLFTNRVPVRGPKPTGRSATSAKQLEVGASGRLQVLPITAKSALAVIDEISAGALRAIAVSSSKRVPFLPDVPTIAESGVPGYWTYSWNGIVAPAKTPAGVVARLNKEINSAIATPDIQKRFQELIMEPRIGTPDDLQKIYDTDVAMWRRIITDANIQPN